MNAMPAEKYGEVTALIFRKADTDDPMHPASAGPKVNGAPVLRVVFEYAGEEHTHDLPNGEFTLSNPALQFLAYVGLQPTDIDGNRYVPSQRLVVPVVRNGEDSYALHNEVLEAGAVNLQNADWTPTVEGDDDEDYSVEVDDGNGVTVHVE